MTEITTTIRKRETQYFGHTRRHDSLQKRILGEKLVLNTVVVEEQAGWVKLHKMAGAPSSFQRELWTEISDEY